MWSAQTRAAMDDLRHAEADVVRQMQRDLPVGTTVAWMVREHRQTGVIERVVGELPRQMQVVVRNTRTGKQDWIYTSRLVAVQQEA